MRMEREDIVLRDYVLSDVEDEVRWTNVDTAWFYADTPWMTMEPADPEELRADMREIMEAMPEDAIRWRLEIEWNGRHIGLVSSYYLREDFTPVPWEDIDQGKNAAENRAVRALGIEICEMDCWGRGVGGRALAAFMDYYRALGERRFFVETWSGNTRMLRCAEKLGFTEVHRTKAAYTVNGREYDALVLEKREGGEGSHAVCDRKAR